MGGIASWGGEAAGAPGAQRGSLQGLPLYFWGRARLFRGHGNAALGLQCQGNVSSPRADSNPFPNKLTCVVWIEEETGKMREQ